jgi:hypothetical protein
MVCEIAIFNDINKTVTVNGLTFTYLYNVSDAQPPTKLGAKIQLTDGTTKVLWEGVKTTIGNKVLTASNVSGSTAPYVTITVCDSEAVNWTVIAVIIIIVVIAIALILKTKR